MRHATLQSLGLKNQQLLSQCLNLGFITEAQCLQQIDIALIALLLEHKMFGGSTHYIWRTQEDDKVRTSHAANDGRLFAWDDRPDTGHPGEDYNCRCWAEPVNAGEYANQLLISPVNDQERWTNEDFAYHYRYGDGKAISLQQAGLLGEVIEHFGYTLEKYDRVNKQIIDAAKRVVEGPVPYDFNNTYDFGGWLSTFFPFFFDGIIFSLGDSTVKGVFNGDVRKEKGYLVINGIMSYEFIDAFTDPTSKVDELMEEEGISRQEAIDRLGGSVDEYGQPYDIKDTWQTKFNATVKWIEWL